MASEPSTGSRAANSGEDVVAPSTIAAGLIAAGYTVVPVRGKTPWDVRTDQPLREWQKASFTMADLPSVFAGRVITGVGVHLGRSGLADVDCDTPEAVRAASLLLPSTATFGRVSNPTSHYIYRVGKPLATARYQVPAISQVGFAGDDSRRQATLLELRCHAAQTVFPGSLWIGDQEPLDTEVIAWDAGCEPTQVDGEVLRRIVGRVAAVTLIARCWPARGSHIRHDFALAWPGWLLNAGVPESDVVRLLDCAARVAGDEEARNRVAGVFTTARRVQNGQRVVGGGRLGEFIPGVVMDRVREWLGLPDRPRLGPVASREPGEDDVDGSDGLEAATQTRFRILSGDAILNIPPPVWIVHGLVERTSLAVLYGAPGTGKSFIALDLALHVAAGLPWHGRAVIGGSVIYIAAEGGAGLGVRCRAWCAWHSRDLPLAFGLITDAPDLYGADNDLEELVASIRVHLGTTAPLLIFVDTLARSMVGGEENSNTDMGIVIARCTRLQREFNATVCLVHHTTKADAERERGATALRGAADTMLLVVTDKPNITLVNDKQKNATEADPIALDLVPVELEGVEGGSCIIGPRRPERLPRSLGRSAEEALAILVQQFGGRASWTRWLKAFMAVTGKSESTFLRAHAALVAAQRVTQDGAHYVAVEPS